MPISGTVVLQLAVLSLASDPTQYVSCGTSGGIGGGGQRSHVTTQEGTFRAYANSNVRLILGTVVTEVLQFTLRALTPAQVTLVKSWIGKTVLFRDTYGRKKYGSYVVTTETDIPLSGNASVDLLTDIGLTFQEISYTEAV